MREGPSRFAGRDVTDREWSLLIRLAIVPRIERTAPSLAPALGLSVPELVDHRRFIRAAIDLDARSGWATQAYAEHGNSSDLAAAIEINRELGAILAAEAYRRGLLYLMQAPTHQVAR